MEKINQTEGVKVSLYELVRLYTSQLQPKYYKQFSSDASDIDDLAGELFLKFTDDEHVNLLDRFEDEVLTPNNTRKWCGYVKAAVRNALIDESRTHPWSILSFDAMLDSYGESVDMSERLASMTQLDPYDDGEVLDAMEYRVSQMTPRQIESLKVKFESMKSVLAPNAVQVLSYVLNPRISVSTTSGMLPVYQVTSEFVTVCCEGKFIRFNKCTGLSEQSGVRLTPKGIAYISLWKHFKSDLTRKEFVNSIY